MRLPKSLLVVLLVACSKKKEAPVVATPAPESKPSVSASAVDKVVEAPEASVPDAPDNAIEAEYTSREGLVLPEGKPINIGKYTPATKDEIKAHAAELQSIFEAQVKDGCKELTRFNASWIPATYVMCHREVKPGAGSRLSADEESWTKIIEVEGSTSRVVEFEQGSNHHGLLSLWNTPRGYFLDLGDGRLTYILRRKYEPIMHGEPHNECIGKAWAGSGADVTEVKVPDYPTRGKDLNGDGKPEFPTAAFSYKLDGFVYSVTPAYDTLCNAPTDDRMTIDVLGVIGDADRGFFERRLKEARARVAKIAKRGDVPRKQGYLRFTNTCAIDVAQTAAELYAYQVMLGVEGTAAIAEADALMKSFALKPEGCEGLTAKGGDGTKDQWPLMRTALLGWKPAKVYEAPADGG